MARLAATHPERVHSLDLAPARASAQRRTDYPGRSRLHRRDRALTQAWGTIETRVPSSTSTPASWKGSVHPVLHGVPRPLSRRTCTPDMAEQLNTIWYDTDIRSVLPTVQVPTLLVLDQEDGDIESRGWGAMSPS